MFRRKLVKMLCNCVKYPIQLYIYFFFYFCRGSDTYRFGCIVFFLGGWSKPFPPNFLGIKKHLTPGYHTVDGRNPAPVDKENLPFFIGFHRSQVVRDFFAQHYQSSFFNCLHPLRSLHMLFFWNSYPLLLFSAFVVTCWTHWSHVADFQTIFHLVAGSRMLSVATLISLLNAKVSFGTRISNEG